MEDITKFDICLIKHYLNKQLKQLKEQDIIFNSQIEELEDIINKIQVFKTERNGN